MENEYYLNEEEVKIVLSDRSKHDDFLVVNGGKNIVHKQNTAPWENKHTSKRKEK
jgi:hypothetical protein